MRKKGVIDMLKRKIYYVTILLVMIISCLYGKEVQAANDSFASATSINVNSTVTDKMAYASSTDYNYYKFTIASPGYVNLNFSHAEEESSAVGWDIHLYNANKEEMKTISSQRSVGNVKSNNIGLPAGTYYVQVENSYRSESTINYQLRVNYVANKSWETEFNDGFVTADTLAVNQTVYGSMMYDSSTDYDYYKITLTRPGFVNMSFSHAEEESSAVGWDVHLYNANREEIKTISSKRSESFIRSNNIGLLAGTYYVAVENSYRSESTIDYQLRVNWTASNSWETEYNDGFLTADVMTINQPIYGSMMYDSGTDYDYYRFTLTKAGYIDVSFVHAILENSSVSWDVTIYNSNRESIKTMGVQGNKATSKMGMVYLSKGTYYVLVDNSYRAEKTIDYQLKTYYTTPKASIKSVKSIAKKKVTLKWKKLKGVSGYEIIAATDKKFKKNKKVTKVSGSKKTKATVKKLKRKKTYYVKMRGYITVNGQKYYGSYSKVKKVKVK